MLDKVEEPLDKLQLIDTLQRLGVSYHFEVEIKGILESIYNKKYGSDKWNKDDLYAIALEFRVLRQHGFNVPQEVFNSFKDEAGNFKVCICEDTRGMLYLYEASYRSIRGEALLDEARDFTAKHLKESIRDQKMDQNLAILVCHALELPLHWRMLRLEARWFIDVYAMTQDVNTALLELARLDFNLVQVAHQDDLKQMSRWWKSTGLGQKLSFARDRLMENFLWTIGDNFEPRYLYTRRIITKLNSLITTIDDVYDVYGTLEELELFTNAVERWEIAAMDQLPDYMKICFLALYNSINEMAYDVLKEQDTLVISYFTNSVQADPLTHWLHRFWVFSDFINLLCLQWAELCKTYLTEAKCYHHGYTPTFVEYMKMACISIGAPLTLVHAYFSVTNPAAKEALECLEKLPDIILWSSMITRLSNDLGTSQRMNEARVADSPFNQSFIDTAVNLARMAQCMYQLGDGHGIEGNETKDRVLLLLVDPIPLV
ncbi:hypothetical protein RJ640_000379 [Escallonia rubra]|uniref:Uncharacterized protein n=1 Tax=Escallonia rubra TaxID=112253 RepID=A0AA88RGU2_9ASTE|nr:hypothetical protein RJ640_000379 [Escallonia rubra]